MSPLDELPLPHPCWNTKEAMSFMYFISSKIHYWREPVSSSPLVYLWHFTRICTLFLSLPFILALPHVSRKDFGNGRGCDYIFVDHSCWSSQSKSSLINNFQVTLILDKAQEFVVRRVPTASKPWRCSELLLYFLKEFTRHISKLKIFWHSDTFRYQTPS